MYPQRPAHNPLLGPGPVAPALMPLEAAAAHAKQGAANFTPLSGGQPFAVNPSAPITHTQCAPGTRARAHAAPSLAHTDAGRGAGVSAAWRAG